MKVSRDDEVSLPFHGALQDAIIWRICSDDIQDDRGGHQGTDPGKEF